MGAMSWSEVELEPEVGDCFVGLNETGRARVCFHIDRLGDDEEE